MVSIYEIEYWIWDLEISMFLFVTSILAQSAIHLDLNTFATQLHSVKNPAWKELWLYLSQNEPFLSRPQLKRNTAVIEWNLRIVLLTTQKTKQIAYRIQVISYTVRIMFHSLMFSSFKNALLKFTHSILNANVLVFCTNWDQSSIATATDIYVAVSFIQSIPYFWSTLAFNNKILETCSQNSRIRIM